MRTQLVSSVSRTIKLLIILGSFVALAGIILLCFGEQQDDHRFSMFGIPLFIMGVACAGFAKLAGWWKYG